MLFKPLLVPLPYSFNMWLHGHCETAGPSFSHMTGLVMATLFASFSLLSAMKGDTKRRPLSITLNSPQNNFKTAVLTHTAAPEVTFMNRAIDPEPGPPCPPPRKKALISSDVEANARPDGPWERGKFSIPSNTFASDEPSHHMTSQRPWALSS